MDNEVMKQYENLFTEFTWNKINIQFIKINYLALEHFAVLPLIYNIFLRFTEVYVGTL